VESRTPRGEALQHPLGIHAVAFRPGGQIIAIASEDQVWFAEVPGAATSEALRISLSVEVRTASAIQNGVVRILSRDELLDRRIRLTRLGGDCLDQATSSP
jgi:hypothetical protein